MRRAALAALALSLLAAPGSARDRQRDPLAGRVAGESRDCLELSRVQGPDIVDQTTILYRQNRSRIWVTHPVDACPSLRPDFSTLIVEPTGTQLCRNDRFRVRTPNSIIPGPVCRFGRFVAYDLPPRR